MKALFLDQITKSNEYRTSLFKNTRKEMLLITYEQQVLVS